MRKSISLIGDNSLLGGLMLLILPIFVLMDYVIDKIGDYVGRKEKSFLKKYDSILLDYCLEREIVVCPTCRTAWEVTCLEEQMEVEWKCHCCGQKFKETPTHTIKE